MSGRLRGYTLLELIIVVALIAALAGVLVTAGSHARARARQTTCASNLHQIGLAVNMYQQDHDGMRPPHLPVLGGYRVEPQLLLCRDDPTHSYALWHRAHTLCDQSLASPDNTFVAWHLAYPCSYFYVEDFAVARWSAADLLEGDPASALAVCPHHGNVIARSRVACEHVPSSGKILLPRYEGLILRLMRDGSVVTRRVVWEHGWGYTTFHYAWLFTDPAG